MRVERSEIGGPREFDHMVRVERSEIGAPREFDHMSDEELERDLIERFIQLFGSKLAISDGSITLDGRALPVRSDG